MINDLKPAPRCTAHLLKYDTAQGSFCGKIEGKHALSSPPRIPSDGKEIKIYAVKDARMLLWRAER